jgi:hypothetical protein
MPQTLLGTRLFTVYSVLKILAMPNIFPQKTVTEFCVPVFLFLVCFKTQVRPY